MNTIKAAKVHPKHRPDVIHLAMPSQVEFLGLLGDCIDLICRHMSDRINPLTGDVTLMEATADDTLVQICHDIHLAVHEAAVNIIEHAYQNRPEQQLRITFSITSDRIEIVLRDQGAPFDPDQVPKPTLDEPQEGGLGVFLIRNLMDEVDYHSDKQGNTLKLVKNLKRE